MTINFRMNSKSKSKKTRKLVVQGIKLPRLMDRQSEEEIKKACEDLERSKGYTRMVVGIDVADD